MDARLDRIKAAFDALDTNSNGYLEAEDFDRLGHRIVQALDVAESSPKAQALHASCRRYWQGLADTLDRNNDGKLSSEEYARFHEPDGYEENVRPYAEALTAICDRDDDGFVQHADLVQGLGAVGFPVENIERLSRALDPQDTGQVSRSEWRTAIEDFFLARGSHAVSDTLV
ncbi:EF-hand domain-containing protein [Actinoallomurus purpureus]|uniref:EF-hand domain-containing protein n=1 Tax=Actinoallomurus purpureus TaxID=478114 RepID=UPI0020930863|nr:EF-hand domain-containing protein [Actinoallomurus purpureus]MCO6010822.1 EF-hand domain-containing protein [Actinoallomurus purpureus]